MPVNRRVALESNLELEGFFADVEKRAFESLRYQQATGMMRWISFRMPCVSWWINIHQGNPRNGALCSTPYCKDDR